MLICQISDLHVTTGERLSGVVDTNAMLRACVAHIGALPTRPDVLLATGDLVDHGRPEEYARVRAALAPLGLPTHVIPGNHDDRGALRAAFADTAEMRGTDRYVQYAIEGHPLRIVMLDTVIPGEGGGRLCAERLDWLDRTLAAAPSRPTLVAMHHPPFTTFIEHMDAIGLDGADAFRGVIARHPQVERVICGHVHRVITSRVAHATVTVCPSPAHQIALDLSPGGVEAFAMEPPGYQLHRWSPATGLVTHTVALGAYPGPYAFD
jgi:3',5'-cyclic AMP phosphodiesterase CpdA